MENNVHNFHIPVMGTCFTIDTPLAVAKYGISSVIPLTDDILVEQMRKYWCEQAGEPFEPISSDLRDSRASRITAYLNLIDKLVKKQIQELQNSPFEPNSEICKYFELLPNNSLRKKYFLMLECRDLELKSNLQHELRQSIKAGNIDVNIMTKLDKAKFENGEQLPYEYSDAASALRGYANSTLDSYIVLSAGFNPNLYGYMAKFPDFFPDKNGYIKKKICLKVSDYRSAVIQGKYLAKHGLVVSEFRIESPLNCGGHAFINDGQLLGAILEEFKQRKAELIATLQNLYNKALANLKKLCPQNPLNLRITAQGGVGSNDEHEFLLHEYSLNSIGWGTPFLLVPEATNVDEETLQKLINATSDEVFLSHASPLGVPFWNLRTSASEIARENRINAGKPGAICTYGYAKLNTEFTENPICTASNVYQKYKLAALEKMQLTLQQLEILKNEILSKSCICRDLAGCALIKKNIEPSATPAICPGPNLINFKKIVSLKEMVDHIYGRCSIISDSILKNRPHLFIKELTLQVENLILDLKRTSLDLPARSQQKLQEVKENLLKGIDYYQNLVKQITQDQQAKFKSALDSLKSDLEKISIVN